MNRSSADENLQTLTKLFVSTAGPSTAVLRLPREIVCPTRVPLVFVRSSNRSYSRNSTLDVYFREISAARSVIAGSSSLLARNDRGNAQPTLAFLACQS
jgi:hypothetical protein